MIGRLLALGMLTFATTSVAALDVTLVKTSKSALGDFTFQSLGCDPQDKLPEELGRGDVEKSQVGRYTVWVDPNDIRQLYGQFTYVLHVRKSAGAFERCTFAGEATGAFDDHRERIDITIAESGQPATTGTIRLPIFGAVAQPALTWEKFKEPQPVFMASATVIRVLVKNDLAQMPVEIVNTHAPAADDPGLWNKTAAQEWRPIHLEAGASRFVEIRIEPSALQAFTSAIVPKQASQDDVLRFDVDYRVVGRGERPLTIDVPVRFKPRSPVLLFMTVIGALLGSLVPASQKSRQFRDWWRAFSAAAVTAILVEFISMVLKANQSELRVLSIDLDPFQLPTAALIGVIMGLSGYRSLEKLRDFLESDLWRGGKKADETP